MSCYFRYITDVFNEAGVTVTPQAKKALDQAIHRLMNVPYKHCMPDCWGQVKNAIGDPGRRRRFVRGLKAAMGRATVGPAGPIKATAAAATPRPRRGGGGG